MRHSAWLNATPESATHEKQQPISRLERLRKSDPDYDPDMPLLEGAAYLIGYLFEVGPVMSAGMGPGPITHTEILAWSDLTGVELQPWEVRYLRRLSFDYLSMSHVAEKADCPAPWGAARAQLTAKTMREQIAALSKL